MKYIKVLRSPNHPHEVCNIEEIVRFFVSDEESVIEELHFYKLGDDFESMGFSTSISTETATRIEHGDLLIRQPNNTIEHIPSKYANWFLKASAFDSLTCNLQSTLLAPHFSTETKLLASQLLRESSELVKDVL